MIYGKGQSTAEQCPPYGYGKEAIAQKMRMQVQSYCALIVYGRQEKRDWILADWQIT